MDNNIRFVPLQSLCMLCSDELPTREGLQGLAARLCRNCIGLLISERVMRDVEQRTKIVRIEK
jgi:hypothetical protein